MLSNYRCINLHIYGKKLAILQTEISGMFISKNIYTLAMSHLPHSLLLVKNWVVVNIRHGTPVFHGRGIALDDFVTHLEF